LRKECDGPSNQRGWEVQGFNGTNEAPAYLKPQVVAAQLVAALAA
jgi:hypothetical protein